MDFGHFLWSARRNRRFRACRSGSFVFGSVLSLASLRWTSQIGPQRTNLAPNSDGHIRSTRTTQMSNAYTRLPKATRIYIGLAGILFSTFGIACSSAPPPHHERVRPLLPAEIEAAEIEAKRAAAAAASGQREY